MKRFLWLALFGAALFAGGLAWFHRNGDEKVQEYLTATVERGDIEDSVSALGALQPLQYVDVGTQVTGQLKTLRVEVGDAVANGDLVAEIDPTLFLARVEESRATLGQLKAQLAERIADERFTAEVFKRNQRLFENKAASEEALQESQAAAERAAAQVKALKAQIQQAESKLVGDEANLRYTKIFAPMTGTIVSLTARQGQTLVASQQAPTILRIADLSTMTVWAQVSEADIPKVNVGMPAYFNTLGQPSRRWHGKVRQIMPTPETVNNVILYNVLFDVENPDGALKTQMTAQVFFVSGKAENALLVPVAALQPVKGAAKGGQGRVTGGANGAEKQRVFLARVIRDGKPEERQVKVGMSTRLFAEVLAGLSEGDTVVVGTSENGGQERPARTPRLR